MSIDWNRFGEVIRAHERFVLTSHVRPDCDALGSELGFAGVLEGLGKQVRIVNAQDTPAHLKFIDPRGKILALGADILPRALADADCLMVLDTSAWVQLGDMAPIFRDSAATRIVLDHHQASDVLPAEVFRDATAEATGRLVVDAARALGVPLTAEMAEPLFAAIATDTGWFRFNSVTAATYSAAAELIAAGAVPSEIHRKLFEQDSLARLHLQGRVVGRMRVECRGRLAYVWVGADDFRETGTTTLDTDDFVNLGLRIKGVQAAIMFVELQPGKTIKVSFRSRTPHFDCSKAAGEFGGGGHKAAAGATLQGTLDDVRTRVLAAIAPVLTAWPD